MGSYFWALAVENSSDEESSLEEEMSNSNGGVEVKVHRSFSCNQDSEG
jgi:hypothetical protein